MSPTRDESDEPPVEDDFRAYLRDRLTYLFLGLVIFTGLCIQGGGAVWMAIATGGLAIGTFIVQLATWRETFQR